MNKWQQVFGAVSLTAVLVFGLYGIVANALEGEPDLIVKDDLYLEECGACHFAYQPGLLPRESWQGIMLGLEDHFGESAELDAESSSKISAYLAENALQSGKPSKLSRLLRGMPRDPPLRITELPAFDNMHWEIPRQLEVAKLEEGFLSPCEDCHREAALGIFDAERLHPGYGPGVWGGAKEQP
jgi:hypothetical protein